MRKILFILLALLLAGCTKTMYVPVESVRTEYQDRYHRDSIYLLDSVFVREKGDTVLIHKYSIEYRDRIRVDSFCKTDSIQVPYPVEMQLGKWEQAKMDVGGVAIGALLLVFVIGVWKIVGRDRRRR